MEKKVKKVKRLYVELRDRNGTFRCAVPNGETIPADVIAGKGWTVKVRYEDLHECPCGAYVGDIENGLCPKCGVKLDWPEVAD